VNPSDMPLSSRVVVDDAARDWLVRLVNLCDEAIADIYRWGRDARWMEIVEGSPREHDAIAVSRKLGPSGAWTAEPLDRGLHTSIIQLGVAVQHLAGIRWLLAAGEVIFPLAPVVRSIVEISGRVTWTMAPNVPIGPRDRVARMLLIEIDDVTRAKSLAKALRLENEIRRYGHALRDLRKVRLPAMFYPSEIDLDRRGVLAVRGERLPGLGGFVATLETPGLYASLSAASHPTLLLMMQAVDRSAMTAKPEDPTASVPLNFRLSDLTYIATLVRNAALSIVKAWTVLAAYQGIAAEDLDNLQDKIDSMASNPT
jgi:hypothetical protein